jgi:hypothetical protein
MPDRRRQPAITLEQEFELSGLLRRSDAFVEALKILRDAEMLDYVRERLDAYVVPHLEAECERALEEFHAYKRELGFEVFEV